MLNLDDIFEMDQYGDNNLFSLELYKLAKMRDATQEGLLILSYRLPIGETEDTFIQWHQAMHDLLDLRDFLNLQLVPHLN